MLPPIAARKLERWTAFDQNDGPASPESAQPHAARVFRLPLADLGRALLAY